MSRCRSCGMPSTSAARCLSVSTSMSAGTSSACCWLSMVRRKMRISGEPSAVDDGASPAAEVGGGGASGAVSVMWGG
eukprot:2987042-Prymnesium_polylepis.1